LFAPRFTPAARRFAGRWEPFAFADLALLIFFAFLVQSSFIVQPGIRVRLPAAPFGEGAPYRAAVVTLTQEGLVFFDDRRTTLEGLRQSFAQTRHDRPDIPLIIEADEGVPQGKLIEIYNMATAAGLREVLLATRVAPEPPP
jgi:biopolymer transport protein ExbD